MSVDRLEVIREICEICGLASVQCFQQLFFQDGLIESVGPADGTQFLGRIFQVFFCGDFFDVHGHGDLLVGVIQGQVGYCFYFSYGQSLD